MDVFLVSAARTAIGAFGGALRSKTPAELGAHVARAALQRAGIEPALVGHVVFGHVIPTGPKDAYVARASAVGAGIPFEVPAFHVNRQCGSGLQAIISAAQLINAGDCGIAVAGGTEVMSRAANYIPDLRWGHRMGGTIVEDGLTGALTDPFHDVHMGVTAENVAARYDISRADQDALALESQSRAAEAIRGGLFVSQIEPIEVRQGRDSQIFDVDEYPRMDARISDFERLKPVFKQDGTVTAGNASGINDGAAAVVLASEEAVVSHGLKPLARLVSYGFAGVDPAYMGIGPVPASRAALKTAGLSVDDLDIVESNEAFAAQACAVMRQLGLDPAKVNPNGSGISLGHPVGATGAIITTKLIYELQRRGGSFGLSTMCIGAGQGIAAIWERT